MDHVRNHQRYGHLEKAQGGQGALLWLVLSAFASRISTETLTVAARTSTEHAGSDRAGICNMWGLVEVGGYGMGSFVQAFGVVAFCG